jgi:hypothetical protein
LQHITANGGANPNDTFKNSFGKIFKKNEITEDPKEWNIRQMRNG